MSATVAETAAAAENGEPADDSMEKLQINDEDEKNASAEDMLGGNTLVMSESEDDETPGTAGKQISPKIRTQRLVDSDKELETEEHVTEDQATEKQATEELATTAEISEQNEEELKQSTSKSKKNISRIIDTDSEQEVEQKQDSVAATKTSDNEDQDIGETSKLKPKKKISALIDTDSEEEHGTEEKDFMAATKTVDKPKKKISAIIDTDSEEEQQQDKKQHKKQSKKLSKKKKQSLDSDDDKSPQSSEDNDNSSQSSDEESNDKKTTKSKLKGIVDSESESERSNDDEPMEQAAQADNPTKKPKKNKPMRVSAKKALDEIQAIQSEQQRLHREAHVSVPYHQPKPRTLKEFLSRRTINKPLAVALAGGSPMPCKKEPRRSMALRMNSDELQAYAKLMEERAKEATEFFKSESEHEDDNEDVDQPMEMKDIAAVLDIVTEDVEQTLETVAVVEADPGVEPINAEAIELAAASIETEPETELIKEPISPCKPTLVTEIVELPRLDLSTLDITPPSKPATPRISEAIRRLRDEKSCDVSPSLKGDANMVIDLETGDMFAKKPTGVDDLLQRMMKTREAKKHKTTGTVNIMSTAHGKLELSKVSIHLHEEEPVNKEQKPGAAYQKMQEQLKTLITKKRMEDLRKKQAEEMEEDIDELDENEDMDIDEEYEPDEKPEKKQLVINDDEEIVDGEIEEDAEEDEEADAESETELEGETGVDAEAAEVEATSSDSEQESEEEEITQKGKRKNRIIRAFQDDNSDEDDVDLLQTPKPNNASIVTATQLQLSAHKLFETELQRTASDEENELLGLCSGKFTQTQISSAAPTASALLSQIPITQATTSSQAPDELEALCSGGFETQPASLPAQETNKILSSDEEPAEKLQDDQPRQKKLSKKRQKKKAKLGFSDDEESDEDIINEDELASDLEEEPAEEVPESFVDYDSEENEIVVQMTKKDRKLRASNFVENEAELSESEWGSADEDEKNMDNYDIELGDEDQFDREKLRSELGQIHARKMLDKDIREVRKIQEMLFEDEEGAVRQRQFRWKNAENGAGFSLDDTRNENGDGDANEGSGDEENEHLWRKIRFEREQLLLEKGLKGEATGSASPLSPAVTNTNAAGGNLRKLTIITAKKTTVELKKSSPFLISKSVSTAQQQQSQRAVRGSFLVRDKETLSKLAGMTKGGAGDVDGTAGTVNVKSAKGKNFVFATLTEEEHETQKRKAADLLNSSSETGINFMKKPRLEPRREKCLIDQLL